MFRVIGLLVVLVAAPFGADRRQSEPWPPGLEGFRRWLDLARTHEPGRIDPSIKAIRSKSLAELDELLGDLNAFTTALRKPGLTRIRPAGPRPAGRQYSTVEQKLLLRLADAERTAGTANSLLRRIALLHTDAAALPGAVPYIIGSPGTAGADVYLVSDGVALGGARTPPHWNIARAAVGAIEPNVAGDPWARHWYAATSAYMFYAVQLAWLPAHLFERKLEIPDDAGVWFDDGCLSEEFSSERVQNLADSERRRGFPLDIPSGKASLERARMLFTQVLARDRTHAEARIRLSRVQWRLGDARTSAAELTALLATPLKDRELRYYAYLFLGAARTSLGDLAAAADAYDQALQLYPTAQSPAIALLLVNPRMTEDLTGRVESVLGRPIVDRTDPWLSYYLGPGRRANSMMSMLWRSPIQ